VPTVTTCPVCAGRTRDGLMCTACWQQLARDLRSVPDLIADLETAASKQARLTPPGPGGLASERNPVGWGAADAAAALTNSLTTWARDISGGPYAWQTLLHPATVASRVLLADPNTVRAHPAAAELWADITGHIHRARATIDRHDRHIDVGDCPDCGGTLRAHLPAADDRPTSINCLTNPAHTWSPDQWLRLGRRILATKGPAT
jgi:hypothetical protein